jgi:hypothetical protein
MEYNRNDLVHNSNNMMFNGGSAFAYILIGITTFILAVATINESDEPIDIVETILTGSQLGGNEKTDYPNKTPKNHRNKTKRNLQVQ